MFRSAALILGLLISTGAVAEPAGDKHNSEPVIIIHAGMLLAVPGRSGESEQSIIVRNGVIEEVRPGYIEGSTVPGEVEIIDLRSAFVLPGLIDLHTHITAEWGARRKIDEVTLSEADRALLGAQHARLILDAGFTTVRNLGAYRGGSGDAIFALRDAINDGKIPGPRIFASGHVITPTGGDADIHGFREEVVNRLPISGVCDGADDCRRAVRLQIKRGADVIKITATGGVLSDTAAGTDQQFTDAELKAIVETAHALGRKVAAHAHGLDGINAALRAGVDSIEHGSFLDDSSIALFKQTGAYLVPTMLPPYVLLQAVKTSTTIPAAVRDKILSVGPRKNEVIRRALEGGLKFGFGTDTGAYPYGQNAKEFELLVEAGMSEMAAIEAATVNAADLIGLAHALGTIEPGRAADIIAVSASPLDDITELQRVIFVMSGGTVHKQ